MKECEAAIAEMMRTDPRGVRALPHPGAAAACPPALEERLVRFGHDGDGPPGNEKRFAAERIVVILKEGEAEAAVAQLTRKHGISAATDYHWKSKYAGAGGTELKRLRELEAENAKLWS